MPLEFDCSFGYGITENSVAFYSENTVVFAAGKLCILLDLDSGRQRCLHLTDRAEVSAVLRCGILVAAAIAGNPPCVCLFNTLSETKKLYSGPDSIQSQRFMSLSTNLRFVAAQGGPPDWTLVIWLSQTREIVTTFNPVGDNLSGSVSDISFNAAGNDELVVVGTGVFKLYEFQNEAEDKSPFIEHIFEKFEKSGVFYAICWPQKENLAVGNSKGEILFFRGIEIIYEMSVIDDVMHLEEFRSFDEEQKELSKGVTSVIATSQLLLCVFSGFVTLVYQGEEYSDYKVTKYIFLPSEISMLRVPGEMKANVDYLTNIIVSPECKDLVGTTREGQLLRCHGFTEGADLQQFTSLMQQQHNEPVIGIDLAQCRSLIASCSQHVVILWNYRHKTQELIKMFREDISAIAIHPSGLYLALGFDYFCRIFSILYNGLRERQSISCKRCSRIGFSSGGHLLALVSRSVIEVYSFVSSELMFRFDGHAGTVTCLDWKNSDSKLVSCDDRGVICEWDIVSARKIWENTLVLSYSSISVNSSTGNAIIAVGSDKRIRCLNNALIQWVMETKKETICVVSHSDADVFYTGTSDGCLVSYTFSTPKEDIVINAHSGKLSAIKLNFMQDFLISAGYDNFIFLWRTADENTCRAEGIFSKLSLVDISSVQEEHNRLKLLRMSLKHISSISEGDFELNCVKHEKVLRTLALSHEQTIDDLNEKITHIKEKMQTILYDSDPEIDLKELDIEVRQEIINTTVKLDEAYKLSNTYAKETEEKNRKYEIIIESLSKEHAKFSCAERSTIDEITERIKVLQNNLLLEEKISKQATLMSEEYKNETRKETFTKTDSLKSSQTALLEDERLRCTHLKLGIEKLRQLTAFKVEDSRSRRNVTAGQVDYDLKEKMQAVTLLKEDFRKLDTALKAKEKVVQSQEKKFFQMRQLVGDLQKSFSVSKTAVEQLMEEINGKELEIGRCKDKIKAVTESIPDLEEDIKLTEDLCSTVTEKVGETVDGYQKKQKTLRETQGAMKRYTSLLHQCISRSCDPSKLVQDISSLFESCKIGFVDETADSDLHEEYDFQIEKLKKSYDLIKGEPARTSRDKTMAEFRMSQENSKILHEVHDIQKETEKLRNVIGEMEAALALQTAQAMSSKVTDDLRTRIEFVIDSSRRDRKGKVQTIEKLDKFIEEQQKEIERFQTMLAKKAKKGK